MANSKQVGGLLGPTLAAVLITEFPLVQPNLYDTQIPPVIYLSGVLMFAAGLAVVRSHNVWARNWTVLITLSGWFLFALGLVRMFAASQYRQATQGATTRRRVSRTSRASGRSRSTPRRSEILEAPERYTGKRYDLAGDDLDDNAVTGILTEAIGRPFSYSQVPLEMIRARSKDMAIMYEWFDRVGYTFDPAALRRDFPDVKWTSYREWAHAQDWKRILA